MTQSDEQTVKQASSSIDKSETKHAFKAIRCRLTGGNAQSSTIQLHFNEDFTYRDATSLLNLIPSSGSSVRQLRIPAGTDPGFLYAVKAMIHESVEGYHRSGELIGLKPHQYVYNASLFALSIVKSKLLETAVVNGHEYRNLIESRFEAHNTATDEITKFSVTYGTDAEILKVPVRIIYQPRWWFRAELLLDENARMI
jgi:hypothetical protein